MANIEKRTSQNGKTSYRVKIRIKGCPFVSKTFSSLTKARDWATQTENKLKDRTNFSFLESKRHTLAELIDKYETSVLPYKKTSSAVDTARHLHEWKKRIGCYFLSHITPALISEIRADLANTVSSRGKKRSCSTVNRYMAALSVVLSYAVRELEWLESNPMSKLSKLPEPPGRVRHLSDDERNRLLASAQHAQNQYLYPAVLLALTTGARRMEVLGLKWEDVDLESCWIVLQDTKNGERRGLPLVEPALSEIKKLYDKRSTKSDFVFPSKDGTQPFDITRSWNAAIKEAGISNFRFHDLRHTCATYLNANGATQVDIATILGHKTLQMVKRYSHVSNKHTQNIVAKMNQEIFGGSK